MTRETMTLLPDTERPLLERAAKNVGVWVTCEKTRTTPGGKINVVTYQPERDHTPFWREYARLREAKKFR